MGYIDVMATQGLLSITRHGKVVAKIITGANGYNVPALAESLRESPTIDPDELLQRAREHGIDGNSLVIQLSPEEWLSGSGLTNRDNDELPELYRTKFYDPHFNPRWSNGTAAYTEIVELEKDNP